MERTRSFATRKLKGSTLLESVLALGLMATMMSFAVGMHARILAADRAAMQIQAWSLAEGVISDYASGNEEQPSVSSGSNEQLISVTKVVKPIAPGLVELIVTCQRNGKTVLERKCILPEQQ